MAPLDGNASGFVSVRNGTGADRSNAADTPTAGAIGRSNFDGFSVASTDVLVKYTLSGDANLYGTVNTLDFTMLAANYNSTTPLWTSGDFNYDGVVNALDFNALATNFGQVRASPALGNLVPEPACVVLPILVLLNFPPPRFRRRVY